MSGKGEHRFQLRLPTGLHLRLERVAADLGISANSLLCKIIQDGLTRHEMEAELTKQADWKSTIDKWLRLNPSRDASAFFADYYIMLQGRRVKFENGKWYALAGRNYQLTGSDVERGIVTAAFLKKPLPFTETRHPETPDEAIPF